jgi:hypothetical protein
MRFGKGQFVKTAHRLTLVLFFFIVCLVGCGPKMATVRGKVTYKGQPVNGGTVYFTPKVPDGQFEAGRPAVAMPDSNGEFSLTTNSKNDGALIGTHNVTFIAPPNPRGDDAEARDKYKKFGNLRLPLGHTVEVKPGTNNFTFELERTP